MNIDALIALGAGFLSFFSPCLLPMVPAYIFYLTGSNLLEEKDKRRKALQRTLGFVIGFTIIFMLLGGSAGIIGRIFLKNKKIFTKISGALIMLFGLNMMGIFTPAFLGKETKKRTPKEITGWFSAVLMGMAFAAGWTPCFGPVLAGILLHVANEGTWGFGTLMLFLYSLGMAIPFLLTALFIPFFEKMLRKHEKTLGLMPKISGGLLLLFGGLLFFDRFHLVSNLFIGG